jgi:hypothetical protein
MHSTKINGTRFFHNGDFSGEVKIQVQPSQVERTDWPEEVGGSVVEVEIPFDDLRGLVFQYLRRRQISALEQMDDDEFERYAFPELSYDE